MLDTSNVTLEEINYEEQPSLSRISHIKYEEDYGFLQDFSFNGQHIALSELRLQPQNDHCEVQFFEGEEEGKRRRGINESKRSNFDGHRKIGTLTLREDSFFKGPFKLPLTKTPIFLRVQSKQNQPLHGRLAENDGKSDIELFDTQGNRKGNLRYHLESKYFLKEPTLQSDDTLHSNQFLGNLVPKKQEIRQEPSSPTIYEKLDINNRQTLNNTLLDASKKHQGSDDEDNRSEKSQIDYLGYMNGSKLEERVAEYRLPIYQKAVPEVRQVDYQSIKRSMEDLGLPNHYEIQTFLQRGRISQVELKEIPEEHPQSLSASSHAQASFQESGSQAEASRPQVMERGTGTYTPIPSRINEERANQSSHTFNESSESMKQKSIQYQQDIISQKYTPSKGEQRILRNSHLPQTHFVRSKQVDSSFQVETMRPERSLPRQQAQLSMRKNVYEVRVGSSRINSRLRSRQSKEREWMSCKQSDSNNLNNNSDYGSEQMLYPEADIIINNLSVNFHRKCFGSKMLQLSIAPTTYSTESMAGNNLIWIGKQYIFKGVGGSNQLNVSLKKSMDDTQQTLAQVKIKVSDLILNKKKCYFQTFLLSKKEVVAILIIGFQIAKRNYNINRQVFPLKATRQTHAQTEFSRSKTTKIKRHSRSPRRKLERIETREAALPSPRLNPIRVRKYQGGRNIKIGRASRFEADSRGVPGPGDYQIESSFSRHALKDI